MGFKERYEKAKKALLSDVAICEENRALLSEFFEFEEYKLKRQNGLPRLDEACYKTLGGYIGKFRNVNTWFANKPWKELTKADIRQVYDALEDGKIRNQSGKPFVDRRSYYNKILKSKPFRLAGKAEIARDVIEYTSEPERDVRFVTEETFRGLVSVVSNPVHLLLFWLAWDIGENINALLSLTKRDFIRQKNPDTGEDEYLVNLPREKIKRSRRTRSEPTLYPETVKYADVVLADLKDEDQIFLFGHRQALKVFKAAAKKAGAECMPAKTQPSWKDLRSGMACHLLKSGWSRDEVNARLGHKPSSKELDAYVNYLAIDRHKPKNRLRLHSLQRIQDQLEEAKQQRQLFAARFKRQAEENEVLRTELARTQEAIREIKERVSGLIASPVGA